MRCDDWRDLLSAQLDGEDDPARRDDVDAHLAGCADCRQWLDRAAAVNRLTRTGPAVTPPDLSAAILAALPPAAAPRRPRRLVTALYAALGLVGAVQLVLGLAQVGGGTTGAHSHAGAGLTATAGHLWHESAAWNVALGAGFLLVALRRSRPTGLVPMLTAFVAMLVLLSLNDLTTGRVDVQRLVSHGFVLAGYALVVALNRRPAGPADPRDGLGEPAPWRATFPDEHEAAPEPQPGPRLRLLPGGPPPATARAGHPAPGSPRAPRRAA
ncbi:zf-HC2 domain-containing protein [Spirilliplanes yamanashiensis]|uniref:Membrane protein n=1 Tax=Spirilliplanes yamanashiensis TaxID=42233 RepID=A0A8J3YEY9_9ACTN|nr:zf-HC2 domain-containing protein [Spirilliplanes yamanashiensis]MDP9815278.1 putative anti-sigma-YlaC factor YlaD [Spirilliplanes yamanashiensis]GIJ06452.1 membrane protein [Spirilliplanes yamanashiensis]